MSDSKARKLKTVKIDFDMLKRLEKNIPGAVLYKNIVNFVSKGLMIKVFLGQHLHCVYVNGILDLESTISIIKVNRLYSELYFPNPNLKHQYY